MTEFTAHAPLPMMMPVIGNKSIVRKQHKAAKPQQLCNRSPRNHFMSDNNQTTERTTTHAVTMNSVATNVYVAALTFVNASTLRCRISCSTGNTLAWLVRPNAATGSA